MCARCAQYVRNMCARCVQGVLNMCARCMHIAHVMFDMIETHEFRKYSTSWVLEKSEEPCRILKKCVHACARCQCHSCQSIGWFCSIYWTLNESESYIWMYKGRIAPNLKNLKKWLYNYKTIMNTRAPDGAKNHLFLVEEVEEICFFEVIQLERP